MHPRRRRCPFLGARLVAVLVVGRRLRETYACPPSLVIPYLIFSLNVLILLTSYIRVWATAAAVVVESFPFPLNFSYVPR